MKFLLTVILMVLGATAISSSAGVAIAQLSYSPYAPAPTTDLVGTIVPYSLHTGGMCTTFEFSSYQHPISINPYELQGQALIQLVTYYASSGSLVRLRFAPNIELPLRLTVHSHNRCASGDGWTMSFLPNLIDIFPAAP